MGWLKARWHKALPGLVGFALLALAFAFMTAMMLHHAHML